MKKVASLLLSFVSLLFLQAEAGPLFRSEQTTVIAGNSGTSSTSETVLSGVANQKIRVYAYGLESVTSDTVDLKCGTTTVRTYNFNAKQVVEAVLYPIYIECAAGESLNYTKGTGTTTVKHSFHYTQD